MAALTVANGLGVVGKVMLSLESPLGHCWPLSMLWSGAIGTIGLCYCQLGMFIRHPMVLFTAVTTLPTVSAKREGA
eukprot:scaffold44_cov411-Prasinococcus_capsulatus_cf.AAC.11